MKQWLISAIFSLVGAVSLGYAKECAWPTCLWNLELTNGYRHDMIDTKIFSFDAQGEWQASDEIKTKNMGLYQIGGKGRFEYCHFLVRVDGDYARGNRGRFKNYVKSGPKRPSYSPSEELPPSFSSSSTKPESSSFYWEGLSLSSEDSIDSNRDVSLTKARIHDVSAKDMSLGLGYLFDVTSCFRLGPVAGWSFHQQSFKTTDSKISSVEMPVFDDLTYKTRWQGGWLGLDLAFRSCCFDLNTGYEYHSGSWHGDYILAGPDLQNDAVSDKRRGKRAHGNVFYLDGRWLIWCGWNAGVGFKCQNWRANDGLATPVQNSTLVDSQSFSSSSKSSSSVSESVLKAVDKVRHARWRCVSITFDLGYSY